MRFLLSPLAFCVWIDEFKVVICRGMWPLCCHIYNITWGTSRRCPRKTKETNSKHASGCSFSFSWNKKNLKHDFVVSSSTLSLQRLIRFRSWSHLSHHSWTLFWGPSADNESTSEPTVSSPITCALSTQRSSQEVKGTLSVRPCSLGEISSWVKTALWTHSWLERTQTTWKGDDLVFSCRGKAVIAWMVAGRVVFTACHLANPGSIRQGVKISKVIS